MSNTLAPSVTHRDSKGRKFVSIVETAYDKAGLGEEEAQRVNDTSGLAKLIGDFIAKARLRQDFADEETGSSYTNPPEYTGPRPIAEQVDILARLFDLSIGNTVKFIEQTLPKLKLPEGAEGWFAFPNLEALASRFFTDVKDPAKQYCRADELVLSKLDSSRRFHNYCKGQLGSNYLRQHRHTVEMLARLAEQQGNPDILIVPAQFGLRHRGRSVRRARALIFQNENEFGLGSLAVGSMLLTHPEREVRWEQLHVDCAGDEYSPGADSFFGRSPYFCFRGGELGFGALWVDSVSANYGSASAFLPQSIET